MIKSINVNPKVWQNFLKTVAYHKKKKSAKSASNELEQFMKSYIEVTKKELLEHIANHQEEELEENFLGDKDAR